MSEAQLYDLCQQLRLLARRDCVTNTHGRLVQGHIDRQVEHLRLQVLSVLESVQDHKPLPQGHLEALATARLWVDTNRPTIQALRREYA